MQGSNPGSLLPNSQPAALPEPCSAAPQMLRGHSKSIVVCIPCYLIYTCYNVFSKKKPKKLEIIAGGVNLIISQIKKHIINRKIDSSQN